MSAPLARSLFTSSVSPLEQAARKTAPSSKRTRGAPRLVRVCRSADSCSVCEPRQRRSCSARRARADSARFPPRCSSSAIARAGGCGRAAAARSLLPWPPPSERVSREQKAETRAPPSLLLRRQRPRRAVSASARRRAAPRGITGLVVGDRPRGRPLAFRELQSLDATGKRPEPLAPCSARDPVGSPLPQSWN